MILHIKTKFNWKTSSTSMKCESRSYWHRTYTINCYCNMFLFNTLILHRIIKEKIYNGVFVDIYILISYINIAIGCILHLNISPFDIEYWEAFEQKSQNNEKIIDVIVRKKLTLWISRKILVKIKSVINNLIVYERNISKHCEYMRKKYKIWRFLLKDMTATKISHLRKTFQQETSTLIGEMHENWVISNNLLTNEELHDWMDRRIGFNVGSFIIIGFLKLDDGFMTNEETFYIFFYEVKKISALEYIHVKQYSFVFGKTDYCTLFILLHISKIPELCNDPT